MRPHVHHFSKAAPAAALVLELCLAGAASAQAPSPAQGERLFEVGERAFRKGDWDRALRAFAEAYELDDKPELLYDIALTSLRIAEEDDTAQSLRAARDAYRRYVDLASPCPLREHAQARLQMIEASLQSLEQERASGEPVPRPMERAAQAQATRGGGEPVARPATATAPGGDATSAATATDARSLTPQPKPAPLPLPAGAQPSSRRAAVAGSPRPTPLYRRWWLWTAVGAVTVGTAVGLAVGLSAPHGFSSTLPDFGPGMSPQPAGSR
jgi:hypothetical protein